MQGFDRDLIRTDSRDGHHFIVVEPFSYTTRAGQMIIIPAGTQTDGASTPHALWPTLPPFGKYWKAAILHDHLYRNEQRPREECDRLLLEAMESLGVDQVTGRIIYGGVVAGGQSSFDEDRKNQGGIK